MNKYIIKLDDKYVAGYYDYLEDEIYVGHNKGFHSYFKGKIEKIELSYERSESIKIEGIRNLKSWIEKVMLRYEAGYLLFDKMMIETVKE